MRNYLFAILVLFASFAVMIGCPPETLPDDDDDEAPVPADGNQ